MLYEELLESESDKVLYKKGCADSAAFLNECVSHLATACKIVCDKQKLSGDVHTLTVALLARHVIEYLDSVCVMVVEGVSDPCLPLLRSSLEATLGIKYILGSDTERRALAYQVAHIHRKIKLLDRIDPTSQAGQECRRYLDGDADKFFAKLPLNSYVVSLKRKEMLETMLTSPKYQAIEAEYQARKKAKKSTKWYAFFNGPNNARELAKCVDWALMYEFCYEHWSNEVHAGSVMNATGISGGDGVFRPIRHPDQFQESLIHTCNFTMELTKIIIEHFAPDQMHEFRKEFVDHFAEKIHSVMTTRLFYSPWRDAEIW